LTGLALRSLGSSVREGGVWGKEEFTQTLQNVIILGLTRLDTLKKEALIPSKLL
jgi:hypothetical protein